MHNQNHFLKLELSKFVICFKHLHNRTIANFSYSDNRKLKTEEIFDDDGKHTLKRDYSYDSAGFLLQISDKFLTETLTYFDNGYGQNGFGDGLIMSTTYNAPWTNHINARKVTVTEDDFKDIKFGEICLKALKKLNFISRGGRVLKAFDLSGDQSIPTLCKGNPLVSEILARKHFPSRYGHLYAYGNHQEMIKAKYFTDDNQETLKPLQPHSFSNLTNIDNSYVIWNSLVKSKFIITEQRQLDWKRSFGIRGEKFVNSSALDHVFEKLDYKFRSSMDRISDLLVNKFSKRQQLTKDDFLKFYAEWNDISRTEEASQDAESIYNNLRNLMTSKQFLKDSYVRCLNKFQQQIPEITKILLQSFASEIGQSPNDVESFEIDANGNHRSFHTGYKHYRLEFERNSNKISKIIAKALNGSDGSETYTVTHDYAGNLNSAPHIGVQSIKYHPLSQKPISIVMDDGKKIEFAYDARGERILKRVSNSNNEKLSELHYFRDQDGQVLMDRLEKHDPSTRQQQIIETFYIYGTRGLIGFIRDDSFYKVVTDHAGSIRLVVKGGRVVAAYDYLPYGELMRKYEADPNAFINFKFAGQEYDEETGLYNFHARLFDPVIGRFYQPDPQSQYYSPYKYAGNSPISLIDPDGEFAFLICMLVGALVGAYLGGANANNRWNPVDWDWKHSSTYFGITGGAIAGSFLVYGLPAAFATVPLAIASSFAIAGGVYITTAAANQKWNPADWDFSCPATWNGVFQGISAGVGFVNGINSAYQFSLRFGTVGQIMFYSVSATAGTGLVYTLELLQITMPIQLNGLGIFQKRFSLYLTVSIWACRCLKIYWK